MWPASPRTATQRGRLDLSVGPLYCFPGASVMTTIVDLMSDAEIGLGRWFAGDSWAAWRAVLKAAFALPMAAEELVVFGELAVGRAPPRKRVRELFVASGLRSGKDSIASL